MSEYIKKENVDTLVDELARAISDERCFMSRGRSTASIMQDILDLPTYSFPDSVEDNTMEWIDISIGKGIFKNRSVKCSKCGNTLDLDGVNCGRGDANFCPNCGADMRKGN